MVTTHLHITYLLTNNVDTRDPIGSKNISNIITHFEKTFNFEL